MYYRNRRKNSKYFLLRSKLFLAKGTLEKNHEYIRYVLPKGTSFAGLSQEDCYLLASHINSIPRVSLNNSTPYDISLFFIGKNNIDIFKIKKIDYDDVNLSIRLLKK